MQTWGSVGARSALVMGSSSTEGGIPVPGSRRYGGSHGGTFAPGGRVLWGHWPSHRCGGWTQAMRGSLPATPLPVLPQVVTCRRSPSVCGLSGWHRGHVTGEQPRRCQGTRATSQWRLKQLSQRVVILNISQPGTVAAPTPPKHEGPRAGVLVPQRQWGQQSRRQVPDSDIGAVPGQTLGEAQSTSLRRACPSAPTQGARPRG